MFCLIVDGKYLPWEVVVRQIAPEVINILLCIGMRKFKVVGNIPLVKLDQHIVKLILKKHK